MNSIKPFRAALIGCGRISVFHIAALEAMPNVSIVAVCDLNEEMARERALKHNIAGIYTDVERMMKEQRPDVVHILTPPGPHLKLAQIAAKYRAHMYIEKPMACSEADAQAIVDAARTAGVEICPGHSRVFDPPFLEACERIHSGEIGRIISVKAEQGFSYEAAARSAVMPWSYTYDWGIIENLIPHPLSIACYFLEEPGRPQVVALNLGRVREAAAEEIRVLIPAKNAIGEVSLSMCNTPEVNRLEVVGTRGRIVVDFNAMSVVSSVQSGLPGAITRFSSNFSTAYQLSRSTVSVFTGILTGKVKRYAGLRNLVTEFYRSLHEGTKPPIDGMDGLVNVRLMDQIKSDCQSVAKQRIEVRNLKQTASSPRLLVTGASGFLGGRLVELLSAKGVATRATSRLVARAKALPEVEWVQCDLGNEEEMKRALAGIETVYHCAAMAGPPGSLEQYEEANVNGTVRLARLAAEAGVRNMVYISSIAVYGMPRGSGPYLDEDAPYDDRAADRGVYTQTKLSAEKALLEYIKSNPAPRTVVIRPGAIYGPGNPIPFGRLKLPSSNNRPIIAGSPNVPMPLIYVDNLIDAMLSAAGSDAPSGSIYNIIDSGECNQGEVAQELRAVSRGRIRSSFVPYLFVWLMMMGIDLLSLVRSRKVGTARYRLKRTVADMRYPCIAAREELNWKPRISLADGLARTVEVALDIPKNFDPPSPRKSVSRSGSESMKSAGIAQVTHGATQ